MLNKIFLILISSLIIFGFISFNLGFYDAFIYKAECISSNSVYNFGCSLAYKSNGEQ